MLLTKFTFYQPKKEREKILLKISDIKYRLIGLWYTYSDKMANTKYRKKYSDYKVDEFNCGNLKFIWGVKSWDDLSGAGACMHTMNDIDIMYDRDEKRYLLGIETAYMFNGNRKEGECKYLRRLLNAFTVFMDNNNYSKNFDYCLFMSNPDLIMSAESIEELYVKFKIFVEGYCSNYGYENKERNT